jgi:prepilin-type N-terminal cleavage/methylation domain-containing protein
MTRGRLAAVRQRASKSDGFALTEMLIVLAILVVVITALTQLFVSASTAEVDMSKRVQAQQDARLALDSLRREIHCAKQVSWASLPTSAITITLGSYCPSTTNGATTDLAFTWCTVGSGSRFALWRYTGNTCSGVGRKWADYLTSGTVFTAYVGPPSIGPWVAATPYTAGQYVKTTASPYLFRVAIGGTTGAAEPTWPTTLGATVTSGSVTFQSVEFSLGRLTVDLPVDVDPTHATQRYKLTDDIVLRNTRN